MLCTVCGIIFNGINFEWTEKTHYFILVFKYNKCMSHKMISLEKVMKHYSTHQNMGFWMIMRTTLYPQALFDLIIGCHINIDTCIIIFIFF